MCRNLVLDGNVDLNQEKFKMPKIDWKNVDEVTAYAKRLGKGLTVFKHPDRANYNITHTSRPELYAGCKVVHQT